MAKQSGIRAGKAFVELGIDDKIGAGLKKAQAKLSAWGKSVTAAGMGMSGIGMAVLAPLAGGVKLFSDMGSKAQDMAARTGLSTEAISELGFAAEQTGTKMDAVEAGIRRMQKSITDAGDGSKEAVEALSALGLSAAQLKGLAPEEQFQLIADRLSQISDPTTRAARAMAIFGKSGTGLLPMIADLKALRQQARDLGLVIDGQTAAAADKLGDAMSAAGKAVKMAAFNVGGALAPVVTALADKLGLAAGKASEFIQSHQGLVVTIAKVAVGVTAAGIGLTALGLSLNGAGAALGVLRPLLTASVGLLGAMLSPVGLLTASVLGLGLVILQASGAGGEAIQWLGKKFGGLWTDASQAISLIGQALAQGNIAAAAKVLWVALKLEFEKGKSAVLGVVEDWRFGFQAMWETAIHGTTVAWIKMISALKAAWANWEAWYDKKKEGVSGWAAKKMIELEGGDDVEFRKRQVDSMVSDKQSQIESERQAKVAAISQERNDTLALADQQHEANLSNISNESDARTSALEKELADAKKAYEAAMAPLRTEIKNGADDSPISQLKNELKQAEDGIGDFSRGGSKAAGTFSTSALFGLAGGSALDRTAKATEETAKAGQQTVALIRDQQFATFG